MTPETFRAARKSLSLSQRQLASVWGMGQNGERTIRRWEKGDVPVNPIAAYCINLMIKEQHMTHQYTGGDVDRAIKLGVHWQDHSPADLYLMAKAQERENRRWSILTAACVIVALASVVFQVLS